MSVMLVRLSDCEFFYIYIYLIWFLDTIHLYGRFFWENFVFPSFPFSLPPQLVDGGAKGWLVGWV